MTTNLPADLRVPRAVAPYPSERRLVLLIGAVHFVNTLDFMMVMPLGPDFAHALAIPTSHLGYIGASYVLAAAVAGIAGAFFLDRFDRRRALAVALGGLVVGTVAGGFATNLETLLLARVVAGAFGGPATAIALAIIADAVPPERRGRALGAVAGAFSVASVLGVPIGLELARLGGWRTPFFAVAALGAITAIVVVSQLPAQTSHLARRGAPTPFRSVLARPVVLLSLSCTALAVIGSFAMVPNLSAYFQLNRGFPREQLGILYLVGGVLSFVALRAAGWASDRYGSPRVVACASLLFAITMIVGFIAPFGAIPVLLIFVGFMVGSSTRFVPINALSSRIPAPAERARFMSAQSAVQHIASGIGAMLGALLLVEGPDGALIGMDSLAWFAVATCLALPILLTLVSRRLP